MEERNPHLFPFPSARPEIKVYPIVPGATLYPVNHNITREALERLQDPEHTTPQDEDVQALLRRHPLAEALFTTAGQFFQVHGINCLDYQRGAFMGLWIFIKQAEQHKGTLYIPQLPPIWRDPCGRIYGGSQWIQNNHENYAQNLKGIKKPLQTWIEQLDINHEEKKLKKIGISLGLSDADLVVSHSGLIVPRQRHVTGQEID
jgi:hypothetical protein